MKAFFLALLALLFGLRRTEAAAHETTTTVVTAVETAAETAAKTTAATASAPATPAAPVAFAGRVTDPDGNAIEFATAVLLREGEQIAGTATDSTGRFTLQAPAGSYRLTIRSVGCETLEEPVELKASDDAGEVHRYTLATAETQIEGVVVSASLIRREADRFIVDVANSPAATGKNGIELLRQAPGVWFQNDRLSLNGSSSVTVYIDDRKLQMTDKELADYLRGLTAEMIRRIEVIPMTGAEFDADSTGGAIRIVLRRQREAGLTGSAAMSWSWNPQQPYTATPSLNLNWHRNRLTLYGRGGMWAQQDRVDIEERTTYRAGDAEMHAASEMDSRYRSFWGSVGGLYDLTDNHSVGLELAWNGSHQRGGTDSYTDFRQEAAVASLQSRYDTRNRSDNRAATLNYIWKLDTVGSTFKVLADWTLRTSSDAQHKRTQTSAAGLAPRDSLYRYDTDDRYRVATVTAALEKVVTPRLRLQTGLKYTDIHVENFALAQHLHDDAWAVDSDYGFDTGYDERIAAAYATANWKSGRVGLVAGLRGEYARSDAGGTARDGFSLFPTANLSVALDKRERHMLAASYARKITRPSFWSLSSQRLQISDYTYQIGNPALRPTFSHDFALTWVVKKKYSLAAHMRINRDCILQLFVQDADNPDLIVMMPINFDSRSEYWAEASLPFQLTKWWSLTLKLMGIRTEERIATDRSLQAHYMGNGSAQLLFTLPGQVLVEVDYWGSTRYHQGTMSMDPRHSIDAEVKRQFFDKRLTVGLTVSNIIPMRNCFTATGEGFTRRLESHEGWAARGFGLRVSYNFKAGKAFRNRRVESGSDEEQSRL